MVISDKETVSGLVQKALEEKLPDLSKNMLDVAGTTTLRALGLKEQVEEIGRIAAGIEAGGAVGKTSWGLVSDLARQDYLCTGLCSVAVCCETLAAVSRIAPIPYRMKIYVGCKVVSRGVMTFRNLCKNAKGELTPC